MHRIGHTSQRLSIVVPCRDEEDVLPETQRRLAAVAERQEDLDVEIIYVDDGSQDRTPDVIRRLIRHDSRVRMLRLSRAFGHQVAVSAGMEAATGDAVVLIDADLQDPPELITEMVDRWRDGYQVAYGQRVEREGETAFKRWSASAFYRVLRRIANVDIPADTGDFRLMDRVVVDTITAMPERDRFIRGMVSWVGFKQVAIPYRRAPRFAGESKYPFWKMMRFAVDAATSFSVAPVRLIAFVGAIMLMVGLCGLTYKAAAPLLNLASPGGSSLVLFTVMLLAGIQLLALGIVGEYVARSYAEGKHRPLYILAERSGFSDQPGVTDMFTAHGT